MVMSTEQIGELSIGQARMVLALKRDFQPYFNEGYEGPREALWLYGKTGVGKSRYCKAFKPYLKHCNK